MKMTKTQNTGNSRSYRSTKSKTGERTVKEDAALAERYNQFLAHLDEQLEKVRARNREELLALGFEEEKFFERMCNLYSEEQLNMTVAELEESLLVDAENKKQRQLNSQRRKSRLAVRVPLVSVNKFKRKSVVPAFVPGHRVSFRRAAAVVPKSRGMTHQPRSGRLGEITYSQNGSPVRIEPAAVPKLNPFKGQKISATRGKNNVLGETFFI